MKAHELARKLLQLPDREVRLFISIDGEDEVLSNVADVRVDDYPKPVVEIKGFA